MSSNDSDTAHETTVQGSGQTTTVADVDVADEPPERNGENDAQTPGSDGQDDEDKRFATLEDVTPDRDANGNLRATDQYVKEFDMWVKARPATDGVLRPVKEFWDDEDKDEITDAELTPIFRQCVTKPDLSSVSEAQVAEMFDYDQQAILLGVLMASREMELLRYFRNELKESEIKMAATISGSDDGTTESAQGNRRGQPR